jgi:putative PEP-CTERM system histidine kinase
MTEIEFAGYLTAGIVYAVLSALLLISWRGHRIGGLIIAACLVGAIWAGFLAAAAYGNPAPLPAGFAIEVMRSGLWLAFLSTLLATIGVSRLVHFLGYGVTIMVLVVGLGVFLETGILTTQADLGRLLNPAGLLISLVGLLLLEQLYRNSPPESRSDIRPLVVGLGGLFAYDMFLYSQGVLLGELESTTWAARGFVNVFLAPFIAIAARRNPDWNLDIFVSRQVVFYSTTLVAVGLYLLLMSAVGYWLTIHGGTWSGFARAVFLGGAALVLVVMLVSSRLRARVKVFLSKHFFRNKYDYREEWLRLIGTLAEFEDSSTRQIVIKALAQIVQSPAGLLWLLDEKQNRYQVVAAYETTEFAPDIETTDALVEFIEEAGWLIDLQEFADDPVTYGDLRLPDWLMERKDAWLLVPLITRHELLGLALLTEAPGPPLLNYEDRDLLKTVGNHIAVHLAQEKSDDLLAEARQFEAYNRLTAFLMHDLNNLIAQLSLVVTNAEKHKRNPDFVDDAMDTIALSVDRMKRVMDQLRRGESDQHVKSNSLRFMVSNAVDRCASKDPMPELSFDDQDAVVRVDAEQLMMVLTHLIQNAQDATPTDGSISVTTARNDGYAIVSVSDNGVGMTSDFIRDRLFRPFDSTKGTQGMGIGAYQAREFARKMGGDLHVQSEVSQGTVVTLSVPLT